MATVAPLEAALDDLEKVLIGAPVEVIDYLDRVLVSPLKFVRLTHMTPIDGSFTVEPSPLLVHMVVAGRAKDWVRFMTPQEEGWRPPSHS